jgi:hypothetical protein
MIVPFAFGFQIVSFRARIDVEQVEAPIPRAFGVVLPSTRLYWRFVSYECGVRECGGNLERGNMEISMKFKIHRLDQNKVVFLW